MNIISEGSFFGQFGGRFVPEVLMTPLLDLERQFNSCVLDSKFQAEFQSELKNYLGRPTPLTYAKNISEKLGGAKVFLKREDLLHTGAHKINNAIGQALLAKRMGKRRVVAETGAGQHGVATAAAAARLGLQCVIYMGAVDCERQKMNVKRMNFFGAKVCSVSSGSKTLKDAVNEAIRDWVTNIDSTNYILGSALGPHPYPTMVREFHRVIGVEARDQIKDATGRFPNFCVACVGGGSNAIGIFSAFLNDRDVQLVGVEAGGKGIDSGKHAARLTHGSGASVGILHGNKSSVLQDENGQICETHSISAGLDYPSVGPEHAYLASIERAKYVAVNDSQALEAFKILSECEGIIPALESSHALAEAFSLAPKLSSEKIILVNLSGRGDKDLEIAGSIKDVGC